MSRVTLKDIAEDVGVDRSTVSRVLSNKASQGGISRSLSERISARAREMQYAPNASAQAVRQGRFNCAALLMSTVAGKSYLPSRLLDGIHDELASADLHLSVAKVPDEKLNSETYVPKMLRALMADGMLINYTHHLPERLVRMVREHGVPSVWINVRQDAGAVYPQNFEAAREATERLLALGHRRIAYVDWCTGRAELPEMHFSTRERLAGYEVAMRAAGLTPRDVRDETPCNTVGRELDAAQRLLRGPDRPTAVLCYFATFVPALLRVAAERGVRVPQDLSVVTFAAEGYRDQGVAVSAMLEPHYDMGRAAVRMLRRRIDSGGPDAPPDAPSDVYGFTFEDLGTCAAPSGAAG